MRPTFKSADRAGKSVLVSVHTRLRRGQVDRHVITVGKFPTIIFSKQTFSRAP